MKNTILLIAIATICYSFQTGIKVSKPKIRVKTIVNLLHDHTTEYFYDLGGHISRIKSSNGNDIAYEYLPGKILRRYNDVSRGLAFIDTMILNKDGLVEQITSNNPSIMMQEREFNHEKNMIKNTSTSYNKDTPVYYYNTYEYRNGNEVSGLLSGGSGEPHWISTSTYYTDQANTIGNENLGSDFAGASSKNPIKTHDSRLVGMPSQISSYNYHYDDKGRIIIKASYSSMTGKIEDSVAYSYY